MDMAVQSGVQLRVENVGGIESTEVEVPEGVTVLAGRNATNRTSLLQAIMAAMGSDSDVVSLKGDAEEGVVELQLDGERYTRRLWRRNGRVVTGGDPYLSEPELADLFAFLLESNEARRTVERGAELRELIMRPVDTAEIEARIEEVRTARRELEAELSELASLAERLPELEERRQQLETEIEETEAALRELRTALEEADASVERSREEEAALQELVDELGDVRSELGDVRFQVERERDSLEALREDLADLDEREAALDADAGEDPDALADEIEQLRRRKESLDADVSELGRIVQFNRSLLEDEESRALLAPDDGDVTEGLVEDQELRCWTCGSTVERERIESALTYLRDHRQELSDERDEVEAELSKLRQRREERQRARQERERLARRRRETEAEIERREQRIEELETEREKLEARIEELEAEIESGEADAYSEVLDMHREATERQFELDSLREERDEVETEIASVEERLERRERLETEREEYTAELEELRTRVERTETAAIEQFNDHMASILDLLDYENIERIWIERRVSDDGRGAGERTRFDLHVVRSTATGTTYEDEFAHLSESEREVTGLVFALAGYLVHDVHEEVPFVLLDSLEAVDADRIARLVDYFADYADYLVVALLDEDARALDDDYRRISDI